MERTNVKRIGLWGFLPLLLLVVGATLVGSCSSDDEDTATSPTDTTPTKQSLLVGKKWYRTKHEYLEFDANGNNNMLSSCRYVVDEKNDRMIRQMKTKVMNSTFDANQWAAIILGAIQSIDLSAFFLLKKSVSTLTDSLLMRKRKSMETASQFMEALSLRTQQTSSKPSHSTD